MDIILNILTGMLYLAVFGLIVASPFILCYLIAVWLDANPKDVFAALGSILVIGFLSFLVGSCVRENPNKVEKISPVIEDKFGRPEFPSDETP